MHTKSESTAESPHRWRKGSAGHAMTDAVPTVDANLTLREVMDIIHREVSEKESINYVYILDEERHLIGLLSIKDLFRLPIDTRIGNVARTEHLVAVRPDMPQERVVYLALKHNIKAVPVTDHDNVFLGVIPSDTILRILHHETHDKLLRMTGVQRHGKDPFDNILTLPLATSIRHRLPWLFLGLVGGLLAAQLVDAFESTLEENLILAAFIPLIVYMSDAVRAQLEVFFIRDIATDHELPFGRYFMRQLLVIVTLAIVLGVLLTGATYVLHRHLHLSLVLGSALGIAIASSIITGICVPFLFSKLKMDPANASGPIATIMQDLLTIGIYLSVATMVL